MTKSHNYPSYQAAWIQCLVANEINTASLFNSRMGHYRFPLPSKIPINGRSHLPSGYHGHDNQMRPSHHISPGKNTLPMSYARMLICQEQPRWVGLDAWGGGADARAGFITNSQHGSVGFEDEIRSSYNGEGTAAGIVRLAEHRADTLDLRQTAIHPDDETYRLHQKMIFRALFYRYGAIFITIGV